MQKRLRLGHVAVHVGDPDAAAAFYTEFLGFQAVGRSTTPVTGKMALLTSDRSEEDHILQLVEKREGEHVAFRVDTLADLKEMHRKAKRQNIPILMAANHGTQVGFFVRDSAGRFVEIYWPTGRTDIEATLKPIDLDLPDEEIMAAVAAT